MTFRPLKMVAYSHLMPANHRTLMVKSHQNLAARALILQVIPRPLMVEKLYFVISQALYNFSKFNVV